MLSWIVECGGHLNPASREQAAASKKGKNEADDGAAMSVWCVYAVLVSELCKYAGEQDTFDIMNMGMFTIYSNQFLNALNQKGFNSMHITLSPK